MRWKTEKTTDKDSKTKNNSNLGNLDEEVTQVVDYGELSDNTQLRRKIKMRKLYYMGPESYEARYTLQLQDWNERVFKARGIDYEITGEELDNSKAI